MEILGKNYLHVWSMRSFLSAVWSECLSMRRSPEQTPDYAWSQLGPIMQHTVIASNFAIPRKLDQISSLSESPLAMVVDLAKRNAKHRLVQVALPCLRHVTPTDSKRTKLKTCCAPFTRFVPLEEWEMLLSLLGSEVFYWILTECSLFQIIGEKGPLAQIAGIIAAPDIKNNYVPQRKTKAKGVLPGQQLKKKLRLEAVTSIPDLSQSTSYGTATESVLTESQSKRKKHHRGKKKQPALQEESVVKYFHTSVSKPNPRNFKGSLMFQHDTILYKRSSNSINSLRWNEGSPFCLGKDAGEALFSAILLTDVGSEWSFTSLPTEDLDHPVVKKLARLRELTKTLADNHQNTNFKSLYYSALAQAKKKATSKLNRTHAEKVKRGETSHHGNTVTSSTFAKIEHHLETEGMVSVKTVFCFTRACIRRVVPEALLGSSNNMKLFLKNVRLFIRAGKDRDFMLSHFMECMATSVDWLKEFRGLGSVQQCLLAKVIWWLMQNFVMTLLKLFFYITPTSGANRNYLVWFPQNVWRSRQHRALRKLCNEKLLRNPVPQPQQQVANVRLLPKHGFKFRPITKFKNIRITKKDPDLLKTKEFLKTVNGQYPEIVPPRNSAITYSRWRQFLDKLNEHGMGNAELYFVVADIKDAYGSMKHDKLMALFKKKVPSLSSNKVDHKPVLPVRMVEIAVRTAQSYKVIGKRLTFVSHNEHSLARGLQPEAILMATEVVEYWDSCKLVEYVSSLLENSYLKLAKKATYKVVQGVPQGWPLSGALCNLYYGEMTKQYLQEPLSDETGVLFRGVDDFLYITTDRCKALRFLQTMCEGIEEYGCSTESKKACTNLTDVTVCLDKRATFCGMTFDLGSGKRPECLPDLQSYAGCDVVERMSLKKPNQPGKTLARRVPNFALIKWSLLYVDNAVNSRETVIKNLYYNFLMGAFHFHAIVKNLFSRERGQRNSSFLMKQIRRCYNAVSKHNMNSRQRWHIKIAVSKKELKWLCYKAFHAKLRRTKSWYLDLLSSLEAQIKQLETEMGQSKCSYLIKQTGKSLPAPFRAMRRTF